MSGQNVSPGVANAVGGVWNFLLNKGKTTEKLALYIVGYLVANGNISLPTNVTGPTLIAMGAALFGLHISTPTPKSGPNQL